MFNGHGDTEIICGHDDEVIIISDKYQNPLVSSLKVDSIWSYLMEKADFKEYIRKNYGLDDGASY